MAVENKYVDADLAANKRGLASAIGPGQQWASIISFEVAAADDNGSVYRLFKNLSPDLIIKDLKLYNDAITGATDYEIGLYETSTDSADGAAVDIDVFLGSTDINAGNARGSAVDGLGAVDIADMGKKLYEHAGHTLATRKSGYDIAITANTVGSGAGTITVEAEFIQG